MSIGDLSSSDLAVPKVSNLQYAYAVAFNVRVHAFDFITRSKNEDEPRAGLLSRACLVGFACVLVCLYCI